MLIRKLEYISLYLLMMGIGFMFEPPLPYTQYPLQMTALLVSALTIDFVRDIQERHGVKLWETY